MADAGDRVAAFGRFKAVAGNVAAAFDCAAPRAGRVAPAVFDWAWNLAGALSRPVETLMRRSP